MAATDSDYIDPILDFARSEMARWMSTWTLQEADDALEFLKSHPTAHVRLPFIPKRPMSCIFEGDKPLIPPEIWPNWQAACMRLALLEQVEIEKDIMYKEHPGWTDAAWETRRIINSHP